MSMPLAHDWLVEEVDGGHVGPVDVWLCRRCGASGGNAWPPESHPRPGRPWFDGEVSDDCVTAQHEIAVRKMARTS